MLEQCIDNGVGLEIPTIDTELIALSEARDLFLENGVACCKRHILCPPMSR